MKRAQTDRTKLSPALLAWYDDHARDLPWRIKPSLSKEGKRNSAYQVWLSEIMLQQTTVATVRERFVTFLEQWPTLEAMAKAPRDDILAAWAGLGYYARARNLHKCAQVLVADYQGEFPHTQDALKSLPGIGDYTSAAIAAIAFDQKAIVMDGNIERVMARLFREATPLPKAKPALKQRLTSVWPGNRHGDFAQSLMDLGAQICRPKSPSCQQCPISQFCEGFAQGDAETFPVKLAKKKKPKRYGVAFLLINASGEIALERRSEKGLLGGMFGLPGSQWTSELTLKVNEQSGLHEDHLLAEQYAPIKAKWKFAGVAQHTFTHFHLELAIYSVRTRKKNIDPLSWHKIDNAGLPTVMKKGVEVGLKKL